MYCIEYNNTETEAYRQLMVITIFGCIRLRKEINAIIAAIKIAFKFAPLKTYYMQVKKPIKEIKYICIHIRHIERSIDKFFQLSKMYKAKYCKIKKL